MSLSTEPGLSTGPGPVVAIPTPDPDPVRMLKPAGRNAHTAAVPCQPPPLPAPFLTRDNLSGLVRRVRRIADLSQRELAAQVGVSPATIGRIESGDLFPSVGRLLRILDAAGVGLVATDRSGKVVQPMRVWDETYDGAERKFPAHLDLILDPRAGEWWADVYGLARPPETFHRDRGYRDAQRRRSQWEVRVQQFRHVPEPPNPDRALRLRRSDC